MKIYCDDIASFIKPLFNGSTGDYSDVWSNQEHTIKSITFHELIGKNGLVTNTRNQVTVSIEDIKTAVSELAFSVYANGKMFILYRPEGYFYANNK